MDIAKRSKAVETRLVNIAISHENYIKLKHRGFAGDSFNDVISLLLKTASQSDSRVGKWNQIATLDEPQEVLSL